MSFQLIDAEKTTIPIEMACAVLEVSASGYYAWKNRTASPRQQRDMLLLAHVRAQFANSHETYGSPRMHAELHEEGIAVGLHRVARIFDEDAEQHPKEYWTQLHSTNPLERLNGEIKQHADMVAILSSEAAIVRLVGALLLEQIGEWAASGARSMSLEKLI